MNAPGARKDPTIATMLSLFFPGAGYAYVEQPRRFVFTLVVEGALFCLLGDTTLGFLLALTAHVFFAISAGGAARLWNERNALALPPPPPLVRRAESRATSEPDDVPPPPPPPPPPPRAPSATGTPPAPTAAQTLDADAFLAELRDAWSARNAGTATDEEFAARKRSAIERVWVGDIDDGVALLEATSALVGAGVVTQAELSRLRMRV